MLFMILILLWVYRRSVSRFFFGMTRPWRGYEYWHRPPMGGWYGSVGPHHGFGPQGGFGPHRGFGPGGFGRF